MKKKKWLGMMELADEKYVTEADPTKGAASKKKQWIRFGMLAACLALILSAGGVWLFLDRDEPTPIDPQPSTDPLLQYADSEYYEIIKKLEDWRIDQKQNSTSNQGDSMGSGSVGTNGTKKEQNPYMDITDRQVTGVLEGDLIKRSDDYIYYINYGNRGALEIYSIQGANSTLINSYDINALFEDSDSIQIYLSEDCKTLTAIVKEKGDFSVLLLDVSDPLNIWEKQIVTIDGWWVSSRMVNGQLLLFTDYALSPEEIDYSDPTTFMPRVNINGQSHSFSLEDIVVPDRLSSVGYTLFFKLSADTLEVLDSKAFLCYGVDYISTDMLILRRSLRREQEATTEFVGVNYQNGFEVLGSVCVDGFVHNSNNQYVMDIYDGILRMVTTTELEQQTTTSASLYCVDLSNWRVVAAVENFAPLGETVRSVRFDKNYAYVYTAPRLSDPVFFFDLSDLTHIVCKNTGTFEGFSNSLVDFENGNLLGIGNGDDHNTIKIEIYREGESSVQIVDAYIRNTADLIYEYKSYYIDRKHQLIGVPFRSYVEKEKEHRYLLLQFDGERLNVVLDVEMNGLEFATRGFYLDGYYYILTRPVDSNTPTLTVHKISV